MYSLGTKNNKNIFEKFVCPLQEYFRILIFECFRMFQKYFRMFKKIVGYYFYSLNNTQHVYELAEKTDQHFS